MLVVVAIGNIVFSVPVLAESQDPMWIKKVVSWWSKGEITDDEFVNAFQYLTDNKILITYGLEQIPNYEKIKQSDMVSTPNFIDNTKNKITTSKNIFYTADKLGKKYHVYVEPLPEWAKHAENSVSSAINFWENHANVEFKKTSSINDDTIIIKWIREGNQYNTGYVIDGKIIEIGLGDSKCGKWQSYDSKTISTLMKHEFGHVVGLEHNSNPKSIMHPIISDAKYATDTNCLSN